MDTTEKLRRITLQEVQEAYKDAQLTPCFGRFYGYDSDDDIIVYACPLGVLAYKNNDYMIPDAEYISFLEEKLGISRTYLSFFWEGFDNACTLLPAHAEMILDLRHIGYQDGIAIAKGLGLAKKNPGE